MLKYFFKLSLSKKVSLICAMLAALACSVIVLAGYHGGKQLARSSANVFGQSVIQQLSREASTPLVQNDKLSLQTLLNELVNSSMITHAVIYDVENNPITEAGQQHDGLSLSASITFQDSIAGYTVITLNADSLNKEALSLAWQLLGLSMLLVLLVYFVSLFATRPISLLLSNLKILVAHPLEKNKRPIIYQGNDELSELAQQILHGPDKSNIKSTNEIAMAILTIEINNINALQQQFDSITINALLKEYHLQLSTICKLYDGIVTITASNCFCVKFLATNNENNFPFRALCSGYLIFQWNKIDNSVLSTDLGLALQEASTDDEITHEFSTQEAIEQARMAGHHCPKNLVATYPLSQHPSINLRVNILENTDNDLYQVIDKLTDPYQELLTRQLTTLKPKLENQSSN